MDYNLSINGENIQRVYEWYKSEKFFVNRKYQRKLVWTVEEKINFIDSLSRQYPVPLFLFSNNKHGNYEIIDGMQRLEAIFSFIQGEFELDNGQYRGYFDLNTMALTKQLLDEGKLYQNEPVLPRNLCTQIANYPLPFSVTDFEDAQIEEVFRRINSGGRQLSKQDLRQAGSVCLFSELVRRISTKVRRDSSSDDILELSRMREISLSNKKLNYGIDLGEVFWVRQGIITIPNMRQSMDEQLVAHLLAFILLGKEVEPNGNSLNSLYGFNVSRDAIYKKAENKISQLTVEKIEKEFLSIIDEFDKINNFSGKSFSKLVFRNKESAKVRSFSVVFLAIWDLFLDRKRVSNYESFIKKLDGLAERELNNVGESDWDSEKRFEKIQAVKSIIIECFGNIKKKELSYENISFLENLLRDSSIERQLLDLKIGLCSLVEQPVYNKECLSKIIKTLTAMSNTYPNKEGFVLLGIADTKNDAEKYANLYECEPRYYNNYYITGIENEANKIGLSLDQYWNKIRDGISRERIPDRVKSYILRYMSMINYYDKELICFKIKSLGEPVPYEGEFYERNGNSVVKLEQASEAFMDMMKRIYSGE